MDFSFSFLLVLLWITNILINWKNHKQMFVVSRLQVVSTRVGGVAEVLPPELIYLADPSVKGNGKLYKIFLGYVWMFQ